LLRQLQAFQYWTSSSSEE